MNRAELFALHDENALAFTMGVDAAFVGVSSALLNRLTDEEIVSVIAHELGHHKMMHIVARNTELEKSRFNMMDTLATPNGSETTYRTASGSLSRYWEYERYAEYSADRFSAYISGSIEVSANALFKIHIGETINLGDRFGSGSNLYTFLSQFDHLAPETDRETAESRAGMSHPRIASRIRSLQAWTLTEAYASLFGGHGNSYAIPAADSGDRNVTGPWY